ncbi:MAG: hypothetical protein NUV34_03985, partial [Sulfuricaulis sp.]|nr:hypothetical protein [Sulfuricaulis sp.]
MKRNLEINTISRSRLLAVALAASLVSPLQALAGSVALATAPLATSSTSTVKPNVMFILDDSGSMSWDYLPDWASDKNPLTSTNYTSIPELFRNNGFNGVAYNPAITYTPPVLYKADGTLDTTTYPDIPSPWTAVKYDAYGIQSYNKVPVTSYQRCPDGNYPSGGAPNGACNLVGSASFYTFVPGEYCSTDNL